MDLRNSVHDMAILVSRKRGTGWLFWTWLLLIAVIMTAPTPSVALDAASLAAEADGLSAHADSRRARAEDWRELEARARARANATPVDADRAALLEDADRYADSAAAAERDAVEAERRAETVRAAAETLDAAEEAAAREAAEHEQAEREAAEDKAPAFEIKPLVGFRKRPLQVTDFLATWSTGDGESEAGSTFVIVQEDPEFEAYPHRLEAHTPNRVWKGHYETRPPGDPTRVGGARLTFTYKPTADEMNPEIPEWARKRIEGELEWKIELNELGPGIPQKLEGVWLPGEVRWRDDGDGADPGEGAEAWVEGPGEPRQLAFNRLYGVDLNLLANATLVISRGIAHDPISQPVRWLVKGQPFWIRATLPAEMAKEQGPTLEVRLRATGGAESDTVTLRAGAARQGRAVTYSLHEAVVIANDNDQRHQDREPDFLSWNWIFGLTGNRLDLRVENAEEIEVSFARAHANFRIYNSWVQLSIDRHRDSLERTRAVLEGAMRSATNGPTVAAAAQARLRMLDNYEAITASNLLGDLHRFHVGEIYFGDLDPPANSREGPTGIIFLSDNQLHEKARDTLFRPLPGGRMNGLFRAFLEGLTGRDTNPSFRPLLQSVTWSSHQERILVSRGLVTARAKMETWITHDATKSLTVGLYEGIAMGTGIDMAYLAISGDDHFGRKRPWTERLLAALNVAQNLLPVSAPAMAGTAGGLGRRASASLAGAGARLVRLPINAARMARAFGAARFRRAIIGRAHQSTKSVGGVQGSALPKGLSQAQRDQTRLAFVQGVPDTPPVACSARRGRPRASNMDELLGGPNLTDALQQEQRQAALRANYDRDLAGMRRNYGPEFEITDRGLKPAFPPQIGGTCNCNSFLAMLKDETGQVMTSMDGHKLAVEIGVFHAGDLVPSKNPMLHGWSNAQISELARAFGAKVSELNPAHNARVGVGHIRKLIQPGGFRVKAVLDLPEGGLHAVWVRRVEKDADGFFTKVHILDPATGRSGKMAAHRFEDLLARDVPNYGILQTFSWADGKGPKQIRVGANKKPGPTIQRPRRTPDGGAGADPSPPPGAPSRWRDLVDEALSDLERGRAQPRPSRVDRTTNRTVHDVLDEMYPNTSDMPALHITSRRWLMRIMDDRRFHMTSGANFSFVGHGTVSEAGAVAIRIKPESRGLIQWLDDRHGTGLIPVYWRNGVGNPPPAHGSIPSRHLQYLVPGRQGAPSTWRNFPQGLRGDS